MTKEDVRKRMLKQRKAMPKKTCAGASQAIVEKILDYGVEAGCDRLFIYNSFKNEVDLEGLCKLAIPAAMPKVTGNKMVFIDIRPETVFEKSDFGVIEPVGEAVVRPTEHSLVLVPGSAFDTVGHRIGYGGGYYDRYLEANVYGKAIGICYDFQLLNRIPSEAHDIKMNMIITEKRVVTL